MKVSLTHITVKGSSTIFGALTKAQGTGEKERGDEVKKKTQWILLMISNPQAASQLIGLRKAWPGSSFRQQIIAG